MTCFGPMGPDYLFHLKSLLVNLPCEKIYVKNTATRYLENIDRNMLKKERETYLISCLETLLAAFRGWGSRKKLNSGKKIYLRPGLVRGMGGERKKFSAASWA